MIRHQGPGKACRPGRDEDPGKPFEEAIVVGSITEDDAALHPPGHHMMHGSRRVQTAGSRHALSSSFRSTKSRESYNMMYDPIESALEFDEEGKGVGRDELGEERERQERVVKVVLGLGPEER